MFTPLNMQHVTLYLVREEAPDAALALGTFGVFEPQPVDGDGPVNEAVGQHYRDTFLSAANRLQKICSHFGLAISPPHPATPRIVPLAELQALDDRLGQLWLDCSRHEEQVRHVREELHAVQQLDEALNIYEPLDIDLGLLQGGFRFLNVRIGTVATDSVESLREAVGLLGYTLTEFSRSEVVTHVLIAGLTDNSEQLDRALGAASFTELRVLAEFGAHPREIRRDLEQRRQALSREQQELSDARAAGLRQHGDHLVDIAMVLALASAYAQMSDTLRRHGGLARITGWVPQAQAEAMRQMLQQTLGDRFVLEVRDPLPEETSSVPSAMRHPRLLRPFARLVSTYGIPRYGEVDPTWLFAFSFVAMFGMMFGDIGHGLVIAAAGFMARRRILGFAPFVVAIGASSTLFGFLYGSVFGYEELIHPLWMSPLSDPALMLRLALYWGIGFIVVMMAITIRNRLREWNFREALLSGSGLSGAVFYFAIILAGSHWFEHGKFAAWDIVAVSIPLAVILGYEWSRSEGPYGERVIVVFIEGFDTLLNYIANTLSFLRVAAFSLNHVALAIAVFTLANMLGPTGHWVTVVLGNLFILVLEGAIVTIQVLRLEYYEGFSRFFSGDGRAFRPLTLRLNTVRSAYETGT